METTITIAEQRDGRLRADYRFVCARQSEAAAASDTEADQARWEAERVRLPVLGQTYAVGMWEYVGPDARGFHPPALAYRPDDGGWRGNSNPAIRRYHGWRGTDNDTAFYALGVRRCLAIRRTGRRSQRIVIVFGRDRKPGVE